MAGSLNRASLIGHVGKDPEIRSTQGGMRIANFSLATSESWRDKNSGEKKEMTEWHRISVFNEGLVKVIEQYVKKGARLYVEGKIQTRKWQDKQGNDRYSTEINLGAYGGMLTILDFAKDDREPGEDAPRRQPDRASAKGTTPSWDAPSGGDLDDEIPF